MKKRIGKLSSLIVASLLCCFACFNSIVNAEGQWDSLARRIETIENVEYSISIVGSLVLRSSTDDELYLLLRLSPKGYAIYNVETGRFEEISLYSTSTPYEKYTEEQCYYFGPGRYCVKKQECFFDLETKKELPAEVISSYSFDEQAKQQREKERSIRIETNMGGQRYGTEQTTVVNIPNSVYFTSLLGEDFGYNDTNSCTAVACGILLGYYDYYINGNYVPSIYQSGYGTTESFHSLLVSLMGSPAGLNAAKNALNNNYFGDVSSVSVVVSTDIGSWNSVAYRVQSKVLQGKPLVAAMFTTRPGCPYNHSAVVYGFTKTEDVWTNELVELMYHCHFGWHSPSRLRSCNYSWFADDLYLP